TVRIWDAQTHLQVGRPLKGHTDWVQSVAFSPDGAQIVSGSADRTIRIWDAEPYLRIDAVVFCPDSYDGWLVGPKGQLILWIPDHLVSSMPQCCLLGICGPHPILAFDPSTVYHGTEWEK
ncbi:WD40-repeat-containing domain protein, partial [Mycena epipterygia]